jgi:tripeptide aminopeptidase
VGPHCHSWAINSLSSFRDLGTSDSESTSGEGILMENILDRFLRYVQIDTQSNEHCESYPSTEKQLNLCRMLEAECNAIGLENVSLSEFGVVMATIPSNVDHAVPTIAWVAHVDTSPEFSGTNVNPIIHENYDGSDIVLPNDTSRIVRVDENTALKGLIGGTIITTDGTTLLGADDKAGIAAIMTAAEFLMNNADRQHGPVRLCFTCDEEIGRGVEKLDLQDLGAICGYTLDGEGRGQIDYETFSADLAVVTVDGINTHPSEGKGLMVNSLRIISQFLAKLPTDTLAPETTDGRDGFMHPYALEGGVATASARIILRDFDTAKLAEQAQLLESIADELRAEHPKATITIDVSKQYRNLGDGLKKEPRAVAKAEQAMKNLGVEPQLTIIRGGTDGSILTENGLPTPNLSTGEHNPHSPLEWTSLEELQAAADVLIELASQWTHD